MKWTQLVRAVAGWMFPLPNIRPQSPSMTIGTPLGRRNWPRCLPVTGS